MSKSASISFSKKQVKFLMEKLGADHPQEALDIFMAIITSEKIDPLKMGTYLDKLMERLGAEK